MSDQNNFMQDCPAWARQKGVQSLPLWQLIELVMPLDWQGRHDRLDEWRATMEKVLKEWDDMSSKQ